MDLAQRLMTFGSVLFLAAGCATQNSQIDQLAEKHRRIRHLEKEVARIGREKVESQQQLHVHQDQVLVKEKEVEVLRLEVEVSSKARREAEDTARMALARVSESQHGKESAEQELMELKKKFSAVQKPETTAVGSTPKEGKYHLRIISLPKNRSGEIAVREIENALSKAGYAAVQTRTSGDFWVIDIGGFQSFKSAEAQSLMTRVRNFKYQGVRQFKTAYFVTY